MNDIMNDKKGQNIVDNSSAHKPGGLLVVTDKKSIISDRYPQTCPN